MKSLLLSLCLTLSSTAFAQTSSPKWSIPTAMISGTICLNGQWYFYHTDSTKFVLYNQLTSSTLSVKFEADYPSGFNAPGIAGETVAFAVPDVSGDGKQDIEISAANDYDYLYIDGSNGAQLYWFSFPPYANSPSIGDFEGNGKNDIVWWRRTQDSTWIEVYATKGISTGVSQQVQNLPSTIKLGQNYPNPFNPSTTIQYSLPSNGNVTLKVYDVLGREVETLVNGRQAAGTHCVILNASRLASGVYFYQLQAGDNVQCKKLMVIK